MYSLAIVMFALSLGGQLFGASNSNVRVFAIGYPSGGTTAVFSISRSKADAQPLWTPESPVQPPLSLYKASSLAKQAVENRGMPLTEWRILDCTLKRFHNDGYRDRWFYVFSFHRPISERPYNGEKEFLHKGVVVFLDGTVVEPTTEPYSLPRSVGDGVP